MMSPTWTTCQIFCSSFSQSDLPVLHHAQWDAHPLGGHIQVCVPIHVLDMPQLSFLVLHLLVQDPIDRFTVRET